MTATLPPAIKFQPLVAGAPLPGGKVYFYAAGTTTPQAVYASDGTTPLANPLVLDANGAGSFRLGAGLSYKIDLYDANGVHQVGWPEDGVVDLASLAVKATDLASTVTGKGAALVGYLAPGTGAVARTVDDKLRDFVSVKDYGATGGGSTDDILAINACLAANQHVYFPPGQYKISAPIDWTNQWIVGAADNGALSLATNQTMILPNGNFSAIRYHHPLGYNSSGGGLKNLNIWFSSTAPAAPNAAIGIEVASTGGYPAFHTFENITVRGATWAINDQSGSWMGKWKSINSQNNYAGFYKQNGTTHVLENCYHRDGFGGFYFANVLGVVMNGCSVDLCSTSAAGYLPFYASGSTVTVNGCDFESNILTGSYNSTILVVGGSVVAFNGGRIFNTQISNTATELYVLKADTNAIVNIHGVDFRTPAYTGSGGLVSYIVSVGGASVSVDGAIMPALSSGTPANIYAGVGSTGSIDFNNVVTPYTWTGLSRKRESSIRSTQAAVYGAVANGASSSGNYNVSGAVLGDAIRVSPTTAVPDGVFFQGKVASAGVVTVGMYNMSGTSQTLGSINLNIVVTQQ